MLGKLACSQIGEVVSSQNSNQQSSSILSASSPVLFQCDSRSGCIIVHAHTAYSCRATPADKKLCFVKEEVFGIRVGGPIISVDHPVMVDTVVESQTAGLGWQVISKPDVITYYHSKLLEILQ